MNKEKETEIKTESASVEIFATVSRGKEGKVTSTAGFYFGPLDAFRIAQDALKTAFQARNKSR